MKKESFYIIPNYLKGSCIGKDVVSQSLNSSRFGNQFHPLIF